MGIGHQILGSLILTPIENLATQAGQMMDPYWLMLFPGFSGYEEDSAAAEAASTETEELISEYEDGNGDNKPPVTGGGSGGGGGKGPLDLTHQLPPNEILKLDSRQNQDFGLSALDLRLFGGSQRWI